MWMIVQAATKKAIATHTIVLVIMMAMFTIVGFFIFYKWADVSSIQASTATCTFKRITYCTDWKANKYGKKPWSWKDKPPDECGEFGITEPSSDDCINLMK